MIQTRTHVKQFVWHHLGHRLILLRGLCYRAAMLGAVEPEAERLIECVNFSATRKFAAFVRLPITVDSKIRIEAVEFRRVANYTKVRRRCMHVSVSVTVGVRVL